MPKLVAIGDSLTQGVQNGAISCTHLSYPELIAETMGLKVPDDFRVPRVPGEGIPLNLEWLLTSLGSDIRESGKWETLRRLRTLLDQVEDYYERGDGLNPARYGGVYHNLAVSGFRVYDSYKVDSEYSCHQINRKEGWVEDDFFGIPSAPTYRIAQRVLNPKCNPERKNWTQVDNLKHLNEREGGVQNLILFLGANDCLATVAKLDMKDMEGKRRVSDDPEKRREKYNLTSCEVFEDNYTEMVERISDAISENTNVFVGNVPHVTIPPITRGIGETEIDENGKRYFEKYIPCFLNEEDYVSWLDEEFNREEVQRIDRRIEEFNRIIEDTIREVPERGNWYLVDICGLLDDLAVRRQAMDGNPESPLRCLFDKWNISKHPLLDLKPIPSVLRFGMEGGKWTSGGLFSLDCFHPTTIGYGLIAEAFLQVMGEENRVPEANLTEEKRRRFWRRIVVEEPLIKTPPALWEHIIEVAEEHPRLSSLLQRVLTL